MVFFIAEGGSSSNASYKKPRCDEEDCGLLGPCATAMRVLLFQHVGVFHVEIKEGYDAPRSREKYAQVDWESAGVAGGSLDEHRIGRYWTNFKHT